MIFPKILLHICCAPCSIPVMNLLEKKKFLITGFWYNPNIWPEEEYKKRVESLVQYEKSKNLFSARGNMPIIYDDYREPQAEIEADSPKRCLCCYEKRLRKTAQTAKEVNADFFTTTLLVSPYQRHKMIIDLAEEIGHEYGVNFYYEDFRSFFYTYKKEARELDLYHQRYCGCKPSIKEAEETRKTRKRETVDGRRKTVEENKKT